MLSENHTSHMFSYSEKEKGILFTIVGQSSHLEFWMATTLTFFGMQMLRGI